jgi:type IX secretion system PorP/SprF family membrane protein
MKRVITTALIAGLYFSVSAQQDAQFSQNMFERLNYNPAYAGMDKAYCASIIGRDQWVNFPGQPKTFLFNGDAYIPEIGGGAGLTVYDDELGFQKTFEVKISYSYHLVVGNGVLGLGLDAGFYQISLAGAWLAPDGTDGQSDPLIPNAGSTTSTYDLGFGAYYSTPQGLYIGISSSHLSAQDVTGTTKSYQWDVARHYYVMAGYTYNASETWDLKPDIYAESDASSTQLQADILAQYNKLIWFGVGYRLSDAVIGFIGLNYGFTNGANLKIGYSYDFTTSQLNSYSSGTHEIMLKYCFTVKKKQKVQFHEEVRFLN